MRRTLLAAAGRRGFTPVGGGPVTHGEQLTADHVGPWALQGTSAGGEDIEVMTTPGRGFWRTDTDAEYVPAQDYVYDNDPANKGGVVPSGGLTIDGVDYPAGTLVCQFRQFVGDFYAAGVTGPGLLFRGCSFRVAPLDAPGYLNSSVWPGTDALSLHYCEWGGTGPADNQRGGLMKIYGSSGGVFYRCYSSWTPGPLQINTHNYSVVECFFEKIEFYFGETGPDGVAGGSDVYHINGIFCNGGELNIRMLRNNVRVASPDSSGRTVNQTDCIALFQDFGTFPGTGTNPAIPGLGIDSTSTGYEIRDNLVGGGGYPFYSGKNAGTDADSVNNVQVIGNKVTTAYWPNGGAQGIDGAPPVWGTFGNVWSDNTWADGPNAGVTIPAP